MSLTEHLLPFITRIISVGGYPALLLFTFLDSTVLPVPNEAVMPFAGYLVFSGRFDFLTVIVVSIVGGVLGALTSYAIGYYGTEKFVARFGKYIGMTMNDVEKTKVFFQKYGDRTILISRFIPVVRQFSSLPAGAGKMNIWKFILYTAVGSTLWNSLMLYLGYQFGMNSDVLKEFSKYSGMLEKIIIIFIIALAIGIFWNRSRKKKTEEVAP